MLKLGVLRVLAASLFGLAIPFGFWTLSRAVGLPLLIAAAVALGLAYGAVKADNPWSGDGLAGNLRLMGVSAAVLAAYVGPSVVAARAIVKRL